MNTGLRTHQQNLLSSDFPTTSTTYTLRIFQALQLIGVRYPIDATKYISWIRPVKFTHLMISVAGEF